MLLGLRGARASAFQGREDPGTQPPPPGHHAMAKTRRTITAAIPTYQKDRHQCDGRSWRAY